MQTRVCKAEGCKLAPVTYSAETVDGSNLTCLNGVSLVVSAAAELAVLAIPEKTPSATTTKPAPSQPKVPTVFGFRPNIVGELGPFRLWATKAEPQSGALSIRQRGLTGWARAEGDISADILFNASQDEATYAYDKLQVSALQTLCCIKI